MIMWPQVYIIFNCSTRHYYFCFGMNHKIYFAPERLEYRWNVFFDISTLKNLTLAFHPFSFLTSLPFVSVCCIHDVVWWPLHSILSCRYLLHKSNLNRMGFWIEITALFLFVQKSYLMERFSILWSTSIKEHACMFHLSCFSFRMFEIYIFSFSFSLIHYHYWWSKQAPFSPAYLSGKKCSCVHNLQ